MKNVGTGSDLISKQSPKADYFGTLVHVAVQVQRSLPMFPYAVTGALRSGMTCLEQQPLLYGTRLWNHFAPFQVLHWWRCLLCHLLLLQPRL